MFINRRPMRKIFWIALMLPMLLIFIFPSIGSSSLLERSPNAEEAWEKTKKIADTVTLSES